MLLPYKSSEVKILGSIFQNGTRRIDKDRIKAILEIHIPENVHELRSFIGSINYIRDWLPNLLFPSILKQKNWPIIQQELYAIVATLTQPNLSYLLLNRKIKLYCDHKNLAYLLTAPEKSRIVKRWLPLLCALDFDVFHVDGESNLFADLLSRLVPRLSSEVRKTTSLLKVSQSWLPLGYMGDLVLGPDKGSLPRDRPSGQVKCHESLTAEFWLKSCVSMVDSILQSLWKGPFLVTKVLRSKSCENSKPIDWLRNSSQYLFLQPFLPQSTNPDYLSAVAAQDRAEHLVEEVLNIDTTRQRCLVRWVGASEPTGNLSLRFATPPLTLSS
ncbi:hypothetical protein GEMRC1_001427 [Eukaryota sp. GEM-RC1]